jgi:hypothetical protein
MGCGMECVSASAISNTITITMPVGFSGLKGKEMSTYTVEKMPDESIVVARAYEGFVLTRDITAINADVRKLADTFDRPGFCIIDTRDTPMDF